MPSEPDAQCALQNESVLSALKLMLCGKIDDAMCKYSR